MLTLKKAKMGKLYCIKSISGNEKTRLYLSNLGFNEGVELMIMSKVASNFIISILDTRYGLDSSMAKLIEVELCE